MENLPSCTGKFSTINERDSLQINCPGAGGGHKSPTVSAHTTTWLAALHVNNNNNSEKSFYPKDNTEFNKIASSCDSCTTKNNESTKLARVALTEEDKGGGTQKVSFSLNGSSDAATCASPSTAAAFTTASFQLETDYDSYDMCGAVSLSPPLLDDCFGAAGGVGGNSNRTSLNNSTENLSFVSDNFYGDDLILLGQDGDMEEELSLNSDDCIYTYRGVGADFDLPLGSLDGGGGLRDSFGLNNPNNQEEETDFLEMDFEPDPLSELEYQQSTANYVMDSESQSKESKDAFLMPRDSCHLVITPPAQRHKLFSSPIDDLPSAPKALQGQSLLSKNFARITLHLDQIQKDYTEEPHADDEAENREGTSSALDSRPLEEEFLKAASETDTSHSLPSILHEHFTNRCSSESAVLCSNSIKECSSLAPPQHSSHKSPSKITGAKPKRLSTFSSTSSTSSKNSSKSRNSLRSAFQTAALCSSSSFDERSVSCAEFRTEKDLISKGRPLTTAPHTAPSTAASLNPEFNNFNDETCLDCLEKEFLASTIGKALDSHGCLKCRNHLSLYNRSLDHSSIRRSTSPTTTYFLQDQPSPTSRLFSCEFLNTQARKRQEWDSIMQETKSGLTKTEPQTKITTDTKDINQSLTNLESKSLNVKLPNHCTVTIPTVSHSESCIVQALDSLNIKYSQELLKSQYEKFYKNSYSSSTNNCEVSKKEFTNLKEFLLHVSKRQGNYVKLKKLIEKVTEKQILVQFKKDSTITDMEMVSVRVVDILQIYKYCTNLEILKELDQRYQDTNILGKIANIIRQARAQRSPSSSRRPEYLYIPQYYASGFLILSKKC